MFCFGGYLNFSFVKQKSLLYCSLESSLEGQSKERFSGNLKLHWHSGRLKRKKRQNLKNSTTSRRLATRWPNGRLKDSVLWWNKNKKTLLLSLHGIAPNSFHGLEAVRKFSIEIKCFNFCPFRPPAKQTPSADRSSQPHKTTPNIMYRFQPLANALKMYVHPLHRVGEVQEPSLVWLPRWDHQFVIFRFALRRSAANRMKCVRWDCMCGGGLLCKK